MSLAREEVSDMCTHRAVSAVFLGQHGTSNDPQGTLSFVNLLVAGNDEEIPRSYLHDLESFFWVLLYVVAEHCEGRERNRKAEEVLSDLNTIDCRALGQKKGFLLAGPSQSTSIRLRANSQPKLVTEHATRKPGAGGLRLRGDIPSHHGAPG